MIRLTPSPLSNATQSALDRYQAEIEVKPTYAEQVKEAKRIWSSRTRNTPFDEVKEKLAAMSPGARRCHYCEDSYADEIEHFRPKDIYPGLTFSWGNFLYACGPCNGPKGNQFSIFSQVSREVINLKIDKSETQPPPLGDTLLINPREEDPFPLFYLDLIDSFAFFPWDDDEKSESFQRAQYTIEVLKLNSRDDLIIGRRNAYGMYKARLTEYITRRNRGAPQERLNLLIEQLKGEQHPFVWLEMKSERIRPHLPELQELFDQAPEAINW